MPAILAQARNTYKIFRFDCLQKSEADFFRFRMYDLLVIKSSRVIVVFQDLPSGSYRNESQLLDSTARTLVEKVGGEGREFAGMWIEENGFSKAIFIRSTKLVVLSLSFIFSNYHRLLCFVGLKLWWVFFGDFRVAQVQIPLTVE